MLTDVKNVDETAPEFQFGNSATQVPSKEERELELSSVYYLPDSPCNFVDGLNIDDGDNALEPCDACPAGKSKRPPFPKESRNPTTAPNQLVHTDLSGIMSGDIRGHRYAHIMVDDFTREGMLNLLHFKSDAAKTLDQWIRRFDSPGAVRSDNARELTRGAWAKRCEERKIEPLSTVGSRCQDHVCTS